MFVELGDTLYITRALHDPTTGGMVDADSAPTAKWYEDGAAGSTTGVTVTAPFDTVTGLVKVAVVCSSGNGFELGKRYSIMLFATIGGVDSAMEIANFQIVAAQNTAGYPVTDVGLWLGSGVHANISGYPLVDTYYQNTALALAPALQCSQATAGGASTITLAASLTNYPALGTVDDFYKGCVIELLSGTGAGQARLIKGYVTATKVATVSVPWKVNPDNTTVYRIVRGPVSVDGWLGGDAPAALSTSGYVQAMLMRWLTDDAGGTPAALSSNGNAVPADVERWLNNATQPNALVSGDLPANTKQFAGTVLPAPAVAGIPKVEASGGSIASVSGAVGSVTGNVGGNVTGSVGSVTTGGLTRASFDQDAKDMLGEGRRNTAAGGSTTTITLDAGASASDNFYNGFTLLTVGGTGSGQTANIASYVGGTKVATLDRTLATALDNTTVFELLAQGYSTAGTPPTSAAIADAVWDEARAGHVIAGSFGEGVVVADLIAAAKTAIVDAFMAYSHDTGLTIKGAFRRMDALIAGKATGLKGTVARFFMRDGTTPAVVANQDTAAGTRQSASVTGSEA